MLTNDTNHLKIRVDSLEMFNHDIRVEVAEIRSNMLTKIDEAEHDKTTELMGNQIYKINDDLKQYALSKDLNIQTDSLYDLRLKFFELCDDHYSKNDIDGKVAKLQKETADLYINTKQFDKNNSQISDKIILLRQGIKENTKEIHVNLEKYHYYLILGLKVLLQKYSQNCQILAK